MYSRQAGCFRRVPGYQMRPVSRSHLVQLDPYAAHAKALHLAVDPLLPLGDKPRNASAQLLALPAPDDVAAAVHAGALGDIRQQPLAIELHMRAARAQK